MGEDNDNVEMKPINKDDKKSDADKMKDLMLAEGDDILIWCSDEPNGKSVFINVGNATISMPEKVFYELTKLTQTSAKALLGLD